MNAELYARPNPKSMRIALEQFLSANNISYSPNDKIENLRQLYIDFECGRIKK